MKLTVLGCGSSHGVPSGVGYWGKCNPSEPKNRRLRTSLAIHLDQGAFWLMDAGPDLRHQMIQNNLKNIQGLFLTHGHADHIMGLDELRSVFFMQPQPIPLYADPFTLALVSRTFDYLIQDGCQPTAPTYKKILIPKPIDLVPGLPVPQPLQEALPVWRNAAVTATTHFSWKGQRVDVFGQDHGAFFSLGYRFGKWAYSTDVKYLSTEALAVLKGIDLWFVDCGVMDGPSPSHAHLQQTLAWIRLIQPKRAILIHMSSELDYNDLRAKLPPGVEPAYDGMEVTV